MKKNIFITKAKNCNVEKRIQKTTELGCWRSALADIPKDGQNNNIEVFLNSILVGGYGKSTKGRRIAC